MGMMFRGAESLNHMGAMSRHPTSFNNELSYWDVSRVTNMKMMFRNAESFNQDLSNWDVSRVTIMAAMFRLVTSFNQDLSNWDVSRVTDMDSMFLDATSFNQDLSKWDVSRVVNMVRFICGLCVVALNRVISTLPQESMFDEASSFQQTLCGAAWVNSKASKIDIFAESPGSISNTVCGAWIFH